MKLSVNIQESSSYREWLRAWLTIDRSRQMLSRLLLTFFIGKVIGGWNRCNREFAKLVNVRIRQWVDRKGGIESSRVLVRGFRIFWDRPCVPWRSITFSFARFWLFWNTLKHSLIFHTLTILTNTLWARWVLFDSVAPLRSTAGEKSFFFTVDLIGDLWMFMSQGLATVSPSGSRFNLAGVFSWSLALRQDVSDIRWLMLNCFEDLEGESSEAVWHSTLFG